MFLCEHMITKGTLDDPNRCFYRRNFKGSQMIKDDFNNMLLLLCKSRSVLTGRSLRTILFEIFLFWGSVSRSFTVQKHSIKLISLHMSTRGLEITKNIDILNIFQTKAKGTLIGPASQPLSKMS